MKIVYVSSLIGNQSSGGGAVSYANFLGIKSVFSSISIINLNELTEHKIRLNALSKLTVLYHSLFKYSAGLSPKKEKVVLGLREVLEADYIWLDGSLFGQLAKKLKILFPEKKIVTFFHNVEFDFMSTLGESRGALYNYIVKSSCYNESMSIQYSDHLVTLSSSDSNRILELYGRAADLILPVTFTSLNTEFDEVINNNNDILFVGSDFPPNVEALGFLCEKVMPFVSRKLVVVGKGMEKYKLKYNTHNVEIIGFVDDVSEFYQNSNIVVTPIFSGAGMKVKVAEALNHGKVVLGTNFSFVGYSNYNKEENFLIKAETSSEYIKLLSSNFPSYSVHAKKYFEDHFSLNCTVRKIKEYFNADLSGNF